MCTSHLHIAIHLVYYALNEVQGEGLHQQELNPIHFQLCPLANGVQADGPLLRWQAADTHTNGHEGSTALLAAARMSVNAVAMQDVHNTALGLHPCCCLHNADELTQT